MPLSEQGEGEQVCVFEREKRERERRERERERESDIIVCDAVHEGCFGEMRDGALNSSHLCIPALVLYKCT